jgi:hypothetical protein
VKTLLGLKPSLVRWLPQVNRAGTPYFERVPDGLRVIESFEQLDEAWLHVSASYENRLPSWEDMREVKETFCGKKREAYIVLPPEERYINDHKYVLHLWCAIDGPVLPDFRRMGPLIRGGWGMTLSTTP